MRFSTELCLIASVFAVGFVACGDDSDTSSATASSASSVSSGGASSSSSSSKASSSATGGASTSSSASTGGGGMACVGDCVIDVDEVNTVKSVAFDPTANKLYVAVWDSNADGEIHVVDTTTDKVVSMSNVANIGAPWNIGVDTALHKVFATAGGCGFSGGTMLDVDPMTGEATSKKAATGPFAAGIAVDATTGTTYANVCMDGVYAFDGTGAQGASALYKGDQPVSIDVDDAGKVLYWFGTTQSMPTLARVDLTGVNMPVETTFAGTPMWVAALPGSAHHAAVVLQNPDSVQFEDGALTLPAGFQPFTVSVAPGDTSLSVIGKTASGAAVATYAMDGTMEGVHPIDADGSSFDASALEALAWKSKTEFYIGMSQHSPLNDIVLHVVLN